MLYVAVVADSIWYTRNMVTHQNGRVELAVGAIIRRRYDEHEQEWNGRNSLQWEPPPCSNIKISFDGAVDKDVIVFAPVCQDDQSNVLSAKFDGNRAPTRLKQRRCQLNLLFISWRKRIWCRLACLKGMLN